MLGGFGAAPAAPAAGGMDMFGGMAGGMGSRAYPARGLAASGAGFLVPVPEF